MYDPISKGVIRQALRLSGMPAPLHINRLDRVVFPTKTVVTAYRLIFTLEAVLDYMRAYAGDELADDVEVFCRVMNECFCADIFTTDWDYSEIDDTVSVTVCTRLPGHGQESRD